MPAAIAIPLALAGGTAAAGIIGSKIQSNASEHAADVQTQAAEQAAQLQSQSAANTLAFEKAQAEADYKNQEIARQANYQQWAANANRLGSLGSSMYGLPARNIPAYVPSVDPGYTGAGAVNSSLAGGSPAAASGATGTTYQPLLDALNKGQTPQAVIDQFNASQGLKTGSSYAWRSIPGAPGGGVVEVPGGAYLAPGPDGTWGYTPAPSGGGSSATAPPNASAMGSLAQPGAAPINVPTLQGAY